MDTAHKTKQKCNYCQVLIWKNKSHMNFIWISCSEAFKQIVSNCKQFLQGCCSVLCYLSHLFLKKDFNWQKPNLLSKHHQTRLQWEPHTVHSITVFCYFNTVLLPSTHVSPLIPTPIIGYVQLQNSTVYTMTQWLPDSTLAPVPGGFSEIHETCREHCRALVQAFHVWLAKIQQQRTPRCRRKLQGRKPLNPLPVWQNNVHPCAGGGRSSTRVTPSSLKSNEKKSSVLEWPAPSSTADCCSR